MWVDTSKMTEDELQDAKNTQFEYIKEAVRIRHDISKINEKPFTHQSAAKLQSLERSLKQMTTLKLVCNTP